MNELNQDEFNRALFAHLIISLAQSAMLGLGKIVNPATQKAEVNLEAAQQAIDFLDMLEAKTKGNLDDEEQKMLKSTLSMLKLNYVETANATPRADAPAAAPASASAPQEPIIAPGGDKPADGDDKVRFRKTYG